MHRETDEFLKNLIHFFCNVDDRIQMAKEKQISFLFSQQLDIWKISFPDKMDLFHSLTVHTYAILVKLTTLFAKVEKVLKF